MNFPFKNSNNPYYSNNYTGPKNEISRQILMIAAIDQYYITYMFVLNRMLFAL